MTAPQPLVEQALAHYARGDLAGAAALCAEALRLPFRHPDALHLLGAIRSLEGDQGEAERLIREALAVHPSPSIRASLGNVLAFQGRHAEAIAELETSLAQAPRQPKALLRLALSHGALGRLDAAVAAYRALLALDPGQVEALSNLALLLIETGRSEDAIELCRRAIALRPDYAPAHNNLGLAYDTQQLRAQAAAAYRRAVALEPANETMARGLISAIVYDPGASPADLEAAHRAYGAAAAAGARPLTHDPRGRDREKRLNLAYLSSDFRRHPIARILGPLIEHHDPGRFAVHLYGEVDAPDEITERLRSQAAAWRPTLGLSDRQVAERLRDDGIDIAVFVAGRMNRNRLAAAAWRGAPVQISFQDCATSGLATMDYILADAAMAPRSGGEWFAERVFRLPSFYTHETIETPAAARPPGAGDGRIVFGSFNHPAKLNDEVLRAWAAILRAVPGSTLLLDYRGITDPAVERRVRAALGEAGQGARATLLGGEPREAMLRRYATVDIALDTWPFSGGVTSFEALAMGVPLVTWAGPTMSARWSASLLGTLSLGELVADSVPGYIALAAALAGAPERLAELRRTLPARIARSPVNRGALRARQIERFYRAAWRRWVGGAP